MKKITLLLFLCFVGLKCQYPLSEELPQPDIKKYLVIVAEITQDYGRVSVEYSTSEVVSNKITSVPTYLAGKAYVVDSKGNQTNFTLDGVKNTDFKGEIGEKYQLFIETEGKKYQSQVETMPLCPKIDTLTSVFNSDPARDFSKDQKYYGFDVSLDTKDLPEQGNYYQWEWVHYQRKVYCALLRDLKTWNKELCGVPCYEDCFEVNYNPNLIILSDELVNGKPINIPIERVPYSTPPNKYYLKIEQRAITKNAFTYLNALVQQTQSNGNQFDVPSQTLFSTNIECINNPKEKVLGIFNLFSSYRKVIVIDRSEIIPNAIRRSNPPFYRPYMLGPLESFPFFPACGTETRYNTKYKPEQWVD